MSDPYIITGPASISFSGGRSSGMMLCKIIAAHGGTLPHDVFVLFCNTGKERDETLVFVDRIAKHLGIPITWLEYRAASKQAYAWGTVNFASASRNGEPFREIVMVRGYMPNPVARICTQNLKVNPMKGFMRAKGYMQRDINNVAGMRFDEPGRVSRGRAREDVNFVFPLYDAGVRSEDVAAFWKAMPFDLELPIVDGKTIHGNCDLCYLKGPRTLLSLIREEPSRADWWADMERDSGKTFRIDRPDYATMKIMATQPGLWDNAPDDAALPCECVE